MNSNVLKKGVLSVYSNYLPKGFHPFIFISLDMPLKDVDVNVHPSKKEVRFLYENDICLLLQTNIQKLLSESGNERLFETKELKINDGYFDDNNVDSKKAIINAIKPRKRNNNAIQSTLSSSKKLKIDNNNNNNQNINIYSHSLCRDDPSQPRAEMDKYLYLQQSQSYKDIDESNIPKLYKRSSRIPLTSISNITAMIENNNRIEYTNLLRHSSYVGNINGNYILFQNDTDLYLLNINKIMYIYILLFVMN